MGTPAASAAESDVTARMVVGQSMPRAGSVRLGMYRYLRYIVKGEHRETLDIWQRQLSLESRGGRQVLRLRQRWDGVASRVYTSTHDALFDAATMAPLSHEAMAERQGTIERRAYRFSGAHVTGDTHVAGNGAADFDTVLPEPAFNFTADLELFQMIPWSRGYSVSVPLYDPGLGPSARHVFRVTGEAVLQWPAAPINCWIVSADYSGTRFWIDKASGVVVRSEAVLPDDAGILVKALLPPEG